MAVRARPRRVVVWVVHLVIVFLRHKRATVPVVPFSALFALQGFVGVQNLFATIATWELDRLRDADVLLVGARVNGSEEAHKMGHTRVSA